jgi:hypothetical protein
MYGIIGKGLEQLGDVAATETSKFIMLVDKFFDCLNVRSISESVLHLKKFRQPREEVMILDCR